MTSEQADIVSLYGVPGIGTKHFAQLVARFGSAGKVFAASTDMLKTAEGIGDVLANSIKTFNRKTFVQEQQRLMNKFGAEIVIRGDEAYPPQLDVFPSAPPVLFVRGDVTALKKAAIAFVGTRVPSSYGIKMTTSLARAAVRAGYCVVSGMAEGIDTAAHKSALEIGGTTVAVFGCGVDIIYPRTNSRLAKSIIGSGCLVSHFPMGMPGKTGNFPARNSVIVGLSSSTVVTEAPAHSGALITAQLTLRVKRPLFSVPGPVDSLTSAGTNALFGSGAIPVMNFNDILAGMGMKKSAYGVYPPKRRIPEGLAGDILHALDKEPLYIEQVCTAVNRTVPDVLAALTMLEIDGFVVQKPGKIFERL